MKGASQCVLFTYALFQLTVLIPAVVEDAGRIKQAQAVLALCTKNDFEMGRTLRDRCNLIVGGRLPVAAAAAAAAAAAPVVAA